MLLNFEQHDLQSQTIFRREKWPKSPIIVILEGEVNNFLNFIEYFAGILNPSSMNNVLEDDVEYLFLLQKAQKPDR
jgi:hypothetical protein